MRAGGVRWGLLGLLCACGSSTGPAATPPGPGPGPGPEPPGPTAEPGPLRYELPPVDPPGAEPFRCAALAPVAAGTKKVKVKVRHYDYTGDDIYPIAGGPRLRDVGILDARRLRAQVREVVVDRAAHLSQCYRWIRFGGAQEIARDHDLRVRLRVEPSGATTVTELVPVDPADGGDRLATCVAGGLTSLQLPPSPRVTEVSGIISFVRSGIRPPGRRTQAPRPRAVVAAPTCTGTPATPPVDPLEVGTIARIDDWELAHAAREHDEFMRRPLPKGARRPHLPIDCVSAIGDLLKSNGRDAIRSNEGAYRDCYRAALARTPGLEGELIVKLHLTDGVQSAPPELSGFGDAELQQCMRSALLELGAYPARIGDGPVVIIYPLRFHALPPAPPAGATALARGEAALAIRDGATAAAAFADAIRASRGGPDECEGRLGVLRAVRVDHPFASQRRVALAAEDLARYAGSPAAADARPTCLEQAATETSSAARWPLRGGGYVAVGTPGVHEAAGRIAALLAAWPAHPEREHLIQIRGISLFDDGRTAELERLLPAHHPLRTTDPATTGVTRVGWECGNRWFPTPAR